MSEIEIVPMQPAMLDDASRVLARAFVTNPLHVAVFGPDATAKNLAFFRIGLSLMRGSKFVATDSSRIIGVVHWVDSFGCQFSGAEKIRMTPALVRAFGFRSARRLGSWLSVWSRNDPVEPHSHFGPIGVEPVEQGRRIGRRLMEHYCETIDRSDAPGYLETDRPENVDFYRRFGFETIREVPILGVKNYLMWRK